MMVLEAGMIQRNRRLGIALSLTATGLLSSAMLMARIQRTGRMTFFFLLWNLFLAAVPFLMSSALVALDKRSLQRLFWPGLAVWLLFFPNAPYIVTDLIHLAPRHPVPLWFDVLLLTAFAWSGLLLGLASLSDVHALVSERYGVRRGWFFASGTLVLASFGVYLGRFQRWNSWDLATRPGALLRDIFDHVTNPTAHPRTVLFTGAFSAFLLLAYVTLHQLSPAPNASEPTASSSS